MAITKKNAINDLGQLLKERVKPEHRNFLYLASGVYPERNAIYRELPYDNIFLVDKSFPYSHVVSDKIFCIKSDATRAVEIFRDAGVKMDFYTSVQEGLNEGGVEYAMNTNAWYGFVLPILKDPYIHLLHRGRHFDNMKRLPFERRALIGTEQESYINPELLTIRPDRAEIWINENRSANSHTFKVNNITLRLLHKSFWEDVEELDLVFSRMNKKMKSRLQNPGKIQDFKTYWRDDDAYVAQCNQLLKICNEKKAVTIGMIPFGWGDYSGFIKWLKDAHFEHTKEIRLYHLAKNDFSNLYSL